MARFCMHFVLLSTWVFAPALIYAQANEGDVPDAAAIYTQYCATCHGADLRGGNASSMVDGVWRYGSEPGFVARNILFGISQVGMPAYKDSLDRKQVEALTRYLLEQEVQSGSEPPHAPRNRANSRLRGQARGLGRWT